MSRYYNSNKPRWHIFKSAMKKYVLVDRDANDNDDWKCWTSTLQEFCLNILTFGLKERDVEIDEDDFTKEEVKTIVENLLQDNNESSNSDSA